MAKSSKLIAIKGAKILLVRRKRDGLWTFPGGRKLSGETELECLQRELREELPKLNLGRVKLWRTLEAKGIGSHGRMSDAIFLVDKASGKLKIGDERELDRANWRSQKGSD